MTSCMRVHPPRQASSSAASYQVVEIKLQVELEEKRKKALNLQKVSRKGTVL